MCNVDPDGSAKRIKSDFTLYIKKEFRIDDKIDLIQDKPKRGGQNKVKERKSTKPTIAKLCFKIAGGEKCVGCNFSHDVDLYMKEKGPNLGKECPVFNLYGRCKYGLKCMFSDSHTTSEFKQIVKNPIKDESAMVKNILPPDIQKQIRSNQIDFSRSELVIKSLSNTIPIESEQEQITNEASRTKNEQMASLGAADFLSFEKEKKKIDFKNKSYLAPLTTVGNIPFRRICKGFGVDITCAEMSIANNLLQGSRHEWALLKRHVSEDLFGVQLTGNHPESFTKTCDVIRQKLEVSFVDLNLGCPVEGITSKGYGSALMERKKKLKMMVKGALSVLDVPLTVKLRTGIKDSLPFAHKLIPLFQEWGVSAVTLHGRSKEQRYTKLADWEYIQKCSSLMDRSGSNSEMAIFGNGDIFNPSEYFEKLNNQFRVDGIMIGRGALIKPWIFKEIKEGKLFDISAGERLDILKDFARFGLEHWGSDLMVSIHLNRGLIKLENFYANGSLFCIAMYQSG